MSYCFLYYFSKEFKANNMMNLSYIKESKGKYKVFKDGIFCGYIENYCRDIGWIFYESEDHEWFGGYETLKDAKQWLECFNGNNYIINKILNN